MMIQIGFMSVIDIRLLPLLSVQDAIFGALFLLPGVLGLVPGLISIFVAFLLVGIQRPTTRRGMAILGIGLFATGALISIFISAAIGSGIFTLAGAYGTYVSINLAALSPGWQKFVKASFVAVAISIICFFVGRYLGSAAISGPGERYLITLEGKPPQAIGLIHSGTEVLLVRPEPGKVVVVPRDQIELLELTRKIDDDQLVTFGDAWAWVRGRGDTNFDACKIAREC